MAEMLPPAYNVPSSIDLPSYSSMHRESEIVLASQPLSPTSTPLEYEYSSGGLCLNMGRRLFSSEIPSYGRNGIIQGTITVKDFKHAESVTLTIVGKAVNSLLDRGLLTNQDIKIVLYHEQTIWALEDEPRPQSFKTYTISFPLPTYARGRNCPLPPSTSITTSSTETQVIYTIRVDMFRKGFHRHMCARTPFLYLPRSTVGPLPGMASSLDNDPSKVTVESGVSWRMSELGPTKEPSGDAIVQFFLPRPTRYVTKKPIPFILGILPLEPLDQDRLLSNLSVTLTKTVTIHCHGQLIRHSTVIGSGTVWKVEGHDEGSLLTLHGSVLSTAGECEMSWGMVNFADVKYGIKVQIREFQSTFPAILHYEKIQMVTHEDLEYGTSDQPALGLAGVPVDEV